jgi:tRNA (mo5U34)-methyltransferase
MNYQRLYHVLQQAGFGEWVQQLSELQKNWFSQAHHGDYERWARALEELPAIHRCNHDLSDSAITVAGDCEDNSRLVEALQRLRPWRKGPYRIADCFIDSEWRSDFKWDRIEHHLAALGDRRILDVGCGNGYHGWRMLYHQPKLVIGIDPSVLFNMQFQVIQHYIDDPSFYMLPIGIQNMPANMQWFDTVFSMGVLYHRKSPFEHLIQLKGLLRPGGELCLETLVIDGGEGQVLVPEARYARMNNVWFLPSVPELIRWLKRAGFSNIRLVEKNRTSVDEQRSTEWMPFESLLQCLDPTNPELTVEGYPAPLRAVILANR